MNVNIKLQTFKFFYVKNKHALYLCIICRIQNSPSTIDSDIQIIQHAEIIFFSLRLTSFLGFFLKKF